MILSILLHYANRHVSEANEYRYKEEFYLIKAIILKKYGKAIGYDVQHFSGKKCFNCGGSGTHTLYSWYFPYNAYDWRECYRCNGTGFYRLPVYVCLERIRFGRFVFHKPLKREEHIGNPFTKKHLGWEVTTNPIIEGRIVHENHWFGEYALLLILLLYRSPQWRDYLGELWMWKYEVAFKGRLKKFFRWPRIKVTMPKVEIEKDDLPF